MTVRLTESQCGLGLQDFYDEVARVAELPVTDRTEFDCKRIHVTRPVEAAMREYYQKEKKVPSMEFSMIWLVYGPKADLDGDGFAAEIDAGFVYSDR